MTVRPRAISVLAVLLAVLGPACSTEPAEVGVTGGREFLWRDGSALPTARTEVAAALLGDVVVVAGGLTADGATSAAVEAYDLNGDTWSSWPDLPEPLHHTALVAAGERVWVVGGYRSDGSASVAVWSLRPGAASWEAGPDLPEPVGAHAAAFLAGRIHVVGGATAFGAGAALSLRHDALDPQSGTWEPEAALPAPRDHLGAAAVGEELFVVGGRELSLDRNTARMDVWDGATRAWRRGPDMPTPRGGLAAAVWRGLVFAVGGEQPSGTFDEVEFYDPRQDEWGTAPKLPTPRHGLAAAGARSRWLVVVGGGPEPGLSVSDATELLESEDER